MLDLTSGELRLIADTEVEFLAMLDIEGHRREWLMSHLVEAVERVGIQRSLRSVLPFTLHPMLDGALAPSNVSVGFRGISNGTSKDLRQVADLPPGTHVIIEPD